MMPPTLPIDLDRLIGGHWGALIQQYPPAPPAQWSPPATPSVMDPAAAAWVLAHVLPARFRASWHQRAATVLCGCQWGICASCYTGRHDRCLTTVAGGPVADGDGLVMDSHGWGIEYVTRASGPCRYRCPCACQQGELDGGAEVQLDLLDLIGVAS